MLYHCTCRCTGTSICLLGFSNNHKNWMQQKGLDTELPSFTVCTAYSEMTAAPASCEPLLSLLRADHFIWTCLKTKVEFSHFSLSWCGHCLDIVHPGINAFPLVALLKEQKRYPHSHMQPGATRGWAVSTQEAYGKPSNQNPTPPALPAFLCAKVCLPNAVTGSLQRCFAGVILGSEPTLRKSRITPGIQSAAYQPFLSSHKHLPLFVTSRTNLPSYIAHELTTSQPVSTSFPRPSSPATALHFPVARMAPQEPQTALTEHPAPSSPQAFYLLCLVKATSTSQQQKNPAAWDSSYNRDEGQYRQYLSSPWASKILAFGYLQNECNMMQGGDIFRLFRKLQPCATLPLNLPIFQHTSFIFHQCLFFFRL